MHKFLTERGDKGGKTTLILLSIPLEIPNLDLIPQLMSRSWNKHGPGHSLLREQDCLPGPPGTSLPWTVSSSLSLRLTPEVQLNLKLQSLPPLILLIWGNSLVAKWSLPLDGRLPQY